MPSQTKTKKRLDLLVTEKSLAPSRERAQALIMSGNVIVNDSPISKPGALVSTDADIRIRKGTQMAFVSRGGVKLHKALMEFRISAENRVALDVGASTGGFTDVLLKEGAGRVIALDVGHNQLDWSLRQNPNVKMIEGVNARNMSFDVVGEKVDILTIDLSFISLTKVLGNLMQFAKPGAHWVALIKPQFEVGPERVGKGGIVTKPEYRTWAVDHVCKYAESLGLRKEGLIESPIKGQKGNYEFLVHWISR